MDSGSSAVFKSATAVTLGESEAGGPVLIVRRRTTRASVPVSTLSTTAAVDDRR
jgi:hypothetical protein